MSHATTEQRDRADEVAERLAVPVLVAALASIPAIFLTLFSEPWSTIGDGLNGLSGAVLVSEAVVLFAVAGDRRAWLRRNRWLVLLAVAIVPAVLFAIGPVQVLRVIRAVGALRIIRVRRILTAGRILRERAEIHHRWQRAIAITGTALAAAFVAIVLTDQTSTSRAVLSGAVELVGVPGIVVAGLLIGGATYVVRANKDADDTDDETETSDGHLDPERTSG